MFQKSKMTLEQKKGNWGWLFIAPWLIGFITLFAVPLFQSLRYSLSELSLTPSGISLDFIGVSNYQQALTYHVDYNRTLIEALLDMLVNVPLIVIFSLLVATLLNQKFKGRMVARAIFFLPVILASGVIASIESGDFLQSMMQQGGPSNLEDTGGMRSSQLERMLIGSG
ncbi:carbohydrate ABC transporter permease [Bacillus sp. JCM 19034]|uniref:carbohydrate ABC transporter permease n=1 Tax=Bacillus sp. JCM 19034 TaxID=1481928 RepID=UPI000AA11E0D